MLKVNFHRFRCWDDLNIEAPIGSITLIKGNSGVGKTTLFQGIIWCLYGNIRLVTPNHMDKAKTKVTIEIPYNLNGIDGLLTINRQKNPNRLVVTHGSNTYEDKVAQALIDDTFGNYDIWLSSCYIGQGCRNNFLTAPNTGKMELLNSIAFHEEDPTFYIERLDSVLTDTDYDYKGKLSIFTNNLNNFQSTLGCIDIGKALSPDQVDTINQEISNLTHRRHSLQIEKSQRDINLGILSNLERQLLQVNNTIIETQNYNDQLMKPNDILSNMNIKYKGYPIDTQDNIQSNIDRATDVIPLLQRRDDLTLETRKYENQLLPYINFTDHKTYTQKDLQNALSEETSYRNSQRLAQSLGVLYSEQTIKNNIESYKNILSSQERLLLERDYSILQNEIIKLESNYNQHVTPLVFPEIIAKEINPPDYSKYNTQNLSTKLSELLLKHGSVQAHIQHLYKGHDVLECPHCKGPIRYQQGKISPADMGPTNFDEIKILQDELSKITSDISKIKQEINNLSNAEYAERSSYEHSLLLEQKRLSSLKEQTKQLELEQQRRDITKQSQFQQIQNLKEQLQIVKDKLNLLPEFIGDHSTKRILTQGEIEQTHSKIAKLNTLTILSPPSISSQHIQSAINHQKLLEESCAAQSNYHTHLNIIPEEFRTESVQNIQSYIDNLRAYSKQIRDISAEILRLSNLKISLETQISTINEKICVDPSPNIDKITNEILNFQELLSLSTKAHQAIEKHKQISKEREEIVNINNTLTDLHSLRQYAVDTECRILQEIVDSINSSIENVCSTLFDSDININLSLFKTMKTTKNVKPIANFSISYRGGTFDNINQMSGGEGDRASLALTLALNRLSSCPILMLDECLASLDINMKDAAIRTIRENTNNTVLIIMHDGVEGIYDNIINCDEFREIQPLS